MDIEDIVENARRLDKDALATLCDIYYDKVFYYIFSVCKDRSLAEDLTNETFIRVVNKISSNKTNFQSWLFTIARNVLNDFFRRKKHEQNVEDGIVEKGLVDKESQHDLYDLLDKLPEDQKEVLQLRFISDLSIKMVASILGKSEGAVKQIQFRALNKLREIAKVNDHD